MFMFSDVVVVVVLCFVGGVLFFLFRVSFFALLLLQNIQPKKVSFIILYDGCVPSFSVALYYSYNLKLTLNSKDLNFGKFFFKLKVSDMFVHQMLPIWTLYHLCNIEWVRWMNENVIECKHDKIFDNVDILTDKKWRVGEF